MAGKVLVAGSHGGIIAAHLGAKAGVHALILNDAGLGKDRAGIAAIEMRSGQMRRFDARAVIIAGGGATHFRPRNWSAGCSQYSRSAARRPSRSPMPFACRVRLHM